MGKQSKLLRGIASLSLAAAVLGVAGCASSGSHSSAAAQREQDRQLAERVAGALNRAPDYKYPDVTITAYRGRVQLSGFVANPAQKQEAGGIAAQIPGVARVENDLLLKQIPGGPAVGGATIPDESPHY